MDRCADPVAPAPVGRRQSWRPNLQQIAGYLIGALGLIWVFRDVNASALAVQARTINWWWAALAMAADVTSYVCQGARWHYLLRPVGTLPVIRATQVVYVGLFTNEIVPIRLGELVRAYVAGRWIGQPISAVIPSMLVGRTLDSVWLAAGVGLTGLVLPLPENLSIAARMLGVAVMALVSGIVVLMVRSPRVFSQWAQDPSTAGGRLKSVKVAIAGVALGVNGIADWRILALAAGFSLGLFVFQALAFWLMMMAYGLRLGLAAGVAVFLVVHVGTILPNAPANVGSFQFFTVLGLSLFGVEKTSAAGFSIVAFLALTLPLWGLGFLALARSGLTLSSIRKDLQRPPAV